MTVTELGWRDALNAVRGARKQAYPNMGFKKLLRIFEQKVSFSIFVSKPDLKEPFHSGLASRTPTISCQISIQPRSIRRQGDMRETYGRLPKMAGTRGPIARRTRIVARRTFGQSILKEEERVQTSPLCNNRPKIFNHNLSRIHSLFSLSTYCHSTACGDGGGITHLDSASSFPTICCRSWILFFFDSFFAWVSIFGPVLIA